MVATHYTAVPLPFQGMRSQIHKKDPQKVLAKNLKAAFAKRKLGARGAERGIRQTQGIGISNRTIQNMLNGTGNPQLEGLLAVSRLIDIPLWQLLCPGFEISQFDETAVHGLLEDFFSLSEIGRKRAQRQIKGEAALEQVERAEHVTDDEDRPAESSDETAT